MKYLDKVNEKKAHSKEQEHKQAVLGAFNGLSKEIRDLLSSLEKTSAKTVDKDFVASVKSLGEVAKKLDSIKVTSDSDIKQALQALASAFSRLDIRPVVNVPAPKVEITEREIDFQPLIDKLATPVKVQSGVTDYRAQDLDELSDPNIQYVGFVNEKGGWYIIENDTLQATLRYKFGKRGYTKGWENRTKHAYKLYNEALGEVSA